MITAPAAREDDPRADAKRRILEVLNARYKTTLTVELIEGAVAHGLTSWDSLRREAAEIPATIAKPDADQRN